MTEALTSRRGGAVPAWTLGWRLQRAIAHAHVSAQEMADDLGVNRGTVSRWMNDRGAPPKSAYIKQWALRCGVSLSWLIESDEPGPQPGAELPRLDSNQKPFD